MSESSPTDWEAHYTTGDLPWDKGAPSPALLQALERVPVRGRALVPGCGLGHDVRALAAAGADAVGLDISASAVAAAERLPKAANERYVHADLFALPTEFAGAFDWIWEHTCFCAIQPARRSEYVHACAHALRTGGEFLGVFYVDPGQALPTDGPPFETRLAELDRLFAECFDLQEEWCPTRAYPGREGREWVRRYRRR